MFILSDNYFFEAENGRVVNYYGRVGSYKTLSAIAIAHTLLKSKRYKRVYANIPVSFASSPPDGIENFDFLSQEYAINSIFIIDESALFLSGKHEEVSKIFAFPRKLNQVFLLASVLPTKQIENYCHLFVKRGFNFSTIGIPLLEFKAHSTYRCPEKEKTSFWLFNYANYFQKYSSKFRPSSYFPIKQYRDTGTLYDEYSREIPREISQFFIINHWGQAIKKKHLDLDATDLVNTYLPEFNEIDDLDENDYPKLKTQKKLNFLGSEFRFSFMFYFVALIYFGFIGMKYLSFMSGNEPSLFSWKQCHFINLASGLNINLCEKRNETTKERILDKEKNRTVLPNSADAPRESEPVQYTIETKK